MTMSTRRGPVGGYLGLILIFLVLATVSVVLVWVASSQQILVNDFYQSQGAGETITNEEYQYWDTLSRNSYQLTTVVAPTLLTGAVIAVFALLTVLAFRWERRRQLVAATPADEARDAS
jgi:hypothetical protein